MTKENGWIKNSETTPFEDGYFIVFCPEYDPQVVVARYDTDLGGWLDFSDEEVTHWRPIHEPPKED